MATYKAEFLSHYYEGRLRPRAAYTMGLIPWWARVANRFPVLTNFLLAAPPFSWIAKFIAGVAQQRPLPKFANESFQDWFARRARPFQGRPPVILWPDTFNNYLVPRTARAAVRVLEHAGFDVIVPQNRVCCGRPLYDFGMLDAAKRLLMEAMDLLGSPAEQGIPIVGLEPSCVAVFRDELPALFPEDERAQKLSNGVFAFAEVMDRFAPRARVPKLYRKALLHGHCHHKAVMGMGADESVLGKMGVEHELLDSGCCGMAGLFGFERQHYDLSVAIGDRKLLPAVREAACDSFIVTDGFSCRMQIEDLTGRSALHLAEAMDLGLRTEGRGPAGNKPECAYLEESAGEELQSGNGRSGSFTGALAGAGILLAGTALWLLAGRRRKFA